MYRIEIVLVWFVTSFHRRITIIPRNKFKYFLLDRGLKIMILSPIKCRMPNFINSFGARKYVIALISMPSERIFMPLTSEALYGFLFRDKEIPVNPKNVNCTNLIRINCPPVYIST